jgi:hypothetical protein
MAINNANNSASVSVNLGSLAASATMPAIYLPKRSALKSVSLQNGGALSGGTDSALVKLQDNNGGTPIDLASIDTSVTAVVADVAAPLASLVPPLAGSVGGNPPSVGYPIDVAAGKSLVVSYTKTGNGSLTNATLVINYYEL